MTEVETTVDVCVVGGGMAGLIAALAAARHGASVALIQDRSVLGGNASSEVRIQICGADHSNNTWRETGILEELRLNSLAHNDEHNPSVHDLALYDAARIQPGLELFLNAQVLACKVERRRVVSCTAHEISSGRRLTFRGKHFVDATGDGTLAFLAGAEYRHGREGRDEHGESLAPAVADNCTLGHSILFQVADVGRPVPFTPPSWALTFETDADLPGRSHGRTFGYWWIEWGGTLDTITDTEQIKDELLAAALGVWDHLKNRGDHGFSNHALTWLGFLPGKRGSRRFIGDYVLAEQDLTEGRRFPDQIAYGGWPIDTHPPLGFRSPEPPCTQTALDRPYGIPLRCCYCRDFDNLFLAGRHISATHVAHASSRVMGTCAAIGQGVGTAAVLAASTDATARELLERHIGDLQQALLADGAYLLDLRSADPADLARQATVSASSCAGADFAPEHINAGCNHPEPGASHAWRSSPAAGLPAWIELRWPGPVSLDRVQVILDTDFGSRLVLTQDPDYRRQVRPVPRAATVKDFEVQVEAEDRHTWSTVASAEGNFQRLARMRFRTVETRALRVVAKATWGAECASLFEVRCYGPENGRGFATW